MHGAAGSGHGGDGFRADVGFRERHVAEILDEDGVRAAAFVSLSVGDSEADDFAQVTPPARRARQRAQMDNADQKFLGAMEERAHGFQAGTVGGTIVSSDAADGCSRSFLSAARAASLSAAFLLLPAPRASSAPP